MVLFILKMDSFCLSHQTNTKRKGKKSNKSFDEAWCLQHNETNEIIANE